MQENYLRQDEIRMYRWDKTKFEIWRGLVKKKTNQMKGNDDLRENKKRWEKMRPGKKGQ